MPPSTARLPGALRPIAAALLLLALLSFGRAQEPGPRFDGVAAVSEDASVTLRWSLPEGRYPDGGFEIVRTSSDGERRVASVASPMPEARALADGRLDAQGYLALTFPFLPDDEVGGDAEGIALLRALTLARTIARPDLAEVLGLVWRDDDVTRGERVAYLVRTADGREVGRAELTVGATPPLEALSGLLARPTSDGINLRFDRPAEERLIVGFEVIEVLPDGSERTVTEEIQPFALPGANGTDVPEARWTDTTARPEGATVRYRVRPVDLFGRVGPSSEVAEATVPSVDPFPVVPIERVDVGDRALTLHWTRPDDPRVVAVGVLRAMSLEEDPELIAGPLHPSITSFRDAPLSGGQDYTYALVTFDADGRSRSVGPLWAERAVNPNPPAAPAGLKVQATETHLVLSWTPALEPDVAHYEVFAGAEDEPVSAMALRGTTTDPRFEAALPVGSAQEVAFRVRAVNSSDVTGPASEAVSGRLLDRTAPAAPTLLEVRGEEEAIFLAWATIIDPEVETLIVERRSVNDGEGYGVVTTLPANATSFLDANVPVGGDYAYRVLAVDGAGNVSDPSEEDVARAWASGAPDTPTGVTLTLRSEPSTAVLAWTPVPGAAGYVVQRATAGSPFVEVSDLIERPTFEIDDPRPGMRFRVVAVGPGFLESEPSEAVAVEAR